MGVYYRMSTHDNTKEQAMVKYDSDRDLLWREINKLVEHNKTLKALVKRQERCIDMYIRYTDLLTQSNKIGKEGTD